ncbi:hypothetical protein [Streptomyces niveiscabiei]|uniref:Uncharacterized protein n=1 Tax=Streptomyces niveiscabiei TaxID=164115 RepID=A0ABW9I4M4_9ACTN
MPLPEGIPTVRLTGRFLTHDGRPLAGQIVIRAPGLITFSEYDVILGGPVTAPLDATGAFAVEIPATDAPGMNPSGWSYTVAEQLAGVPTNRVYQVLLPAVVPEADLADLAPTDPTTPNYVAVRGDSAYEVAVRQGFEGTVEQWLASLVGPQGSAGAPGPAGTPGIVQSVNGHSAANVVLEADDVNAVPTTAVGAADGVAGLDATGRVPVAQLPGDVALKSTDTPLASTTTPAADPHLSLPVAAGIYDVELIAAWTTGGGGLRATWAVPAGASMVWTDNDGVGATAANSVVTFTSANGTCFKGTLIAPAAGTVAFQWAQNTANTNPTTLRAGCSLRLTRIA